MIKSCIDQRRIKNGRDFFTFFRRFFGDRRFGIKREWQSNGRNQSSGIFGALTTASLTRPYIGIKKSPALRGLSVFWRLSLIGGLSGCGRRRVGHILEQALAPRFPRVNNGPGCFPARLVKLRCRYCPRLIFFFFAPFCEPLFSSPFS